MQLGDCLNFFRIGRHSFLRDDVTHEGNGVFGKFQFLSVYFNTKLVAFGYENLQSIVMFFLCLSMSDDVISHADYTWHVTNELSDFYFKYFGLYVETKGGIGNDQNMSKMSSVVRIPRQAGHANTHFVSSPW